MATLRKYPEGASDSFKRQIDRLSDLTAYAYGFSDDKPGWSFWAIILGMVAFILFMVIHNA